MTTLKGEPEIDSEEEYYYVKAICGNNSPTDDGMIRRIFVIRGFVTSEIILNPDNNYEKIIEFHRLSGGATIGVYYEKESRKHGFEILELVGSADQVQKAENLIRTAIRKIYEQFYENLPITPPPFLESRFLYKRIQLAEHEICMLTGRNRINLYILEGHTGAWLEIDADDNTSELNGILIYGSHVSQVDKAFDLLTKIISKFEPVTEDRAWDLLCEEIPALKEPVTEERACDLREAEKQPPSKKQRIMNLAVGNETTDMECVVVT